MRHDDFWGFFRHSQKSCSLVTELSKDDCYIFMLIGIQVVLHKQSKAKLSDRSFLLFKISELELFYPKTKRVPMFKSSFFKLLFFFFLTVPRRGVELYCLQEVRWHCASTRMIFGKDSRYKTFWIGSDNGNGTQESVFFLLKNRLKTFMTSTEYLTALWW